MYEVFRVKTDKNGEESWTNFGKLDSKEEAEQFAKEMKNEILGYDPEDNSEFVIEEV